MERTEVRNLKEWAHLQRKRKVESLENQECQNLIQKLKQSSKYIIFAIVFDYFHYSLWEKFPEHLQLYVYDSSQSLAFLFYIYAIFKMIPKKLMVMYSIVSMWLWFSIGDVVAMVYSNKTIETIPFEYYCLYFNIVMLCYKFRDYLYLQWEIFRFNLKIDGYEGILV